MEEDSNSDIYSYTSDDNEEIEKHDDNILDQTIFITNAITIGKKITKNEKTDLLINKSSSGKTIIFEILNCEESEKRF